MAYVATLPDQTLKSLKYINWDIYHEIIKLRAILEVKLCEKEYKEWQERNKEWKALKKKWDEEVKEEQQKRELKELARLKKKYE